MEINASTRLTGIIGYPVKHSLSPEMHNAAFEYLGLNYCYVAMEVRPENIKYAIEGLKALGFVGVNVTVPHKQAVIPFIDVIDEEAKFIGAINTIKNEQGRLIGYNTDGKGFIQSLKEEGIDPSGMEVLILGAGGAARAVGYSLVRKVSRMYIYNRTEERGMELAVRLKKMNPEVIFTKNLDYCKVCDMVINATSVGLKDSDPLPIDTDYLTQGQIVYDLIYRETPLLREAKQKGCRVIDGTGMLLHQGAEAFRIWTGVEPPVEVMREVLLKRLRE